ncbi:hypothetical protein BYT27DRAFT_6396588 [Phlegmacium glaucopus]|nr:hypothetical protein BYT27DRAFT_6396588 [Phlegmacium glaucopus]
MSFSVEDLVSSLSKSHISQEANDLAILQLAQSLFSASNSTSRGGPSRGLQNTQPCNTPMARTRASSFVSWNRQTSQRLAELHLDHDMEEDERMVEELLIPSSPMSPSFHKPGTPHFSTSPVSSSHISSSSASSQSHSDLCSPSSVFTSTDPFYIAQLQASQSFNNSSPQSPFSQNGHISPNSPFAIPLQTQFHHHHSSQYQNWDNQPMAMTCATAF